MALTLKVLSAENAPVPVLVIDGALKVISPPECTAPKLLNAEAVVTLALPVPDVAATMRELLPPKVRLFTPTVMLPVVETMALSASANVPALMSMLPPSRVAPLAMLMLTSLLLLLPLMSSTPPACRRPALALTV